MKRFLLLIALLVCLQSYSQNISGYWYGNANVKISGVASNYLIELILNENRGNLTGIMNYYFKNTYRSIQVKGYYNKNTRYVSINNIPLTYYASMSNRDVDCIMDLVASVRVARAGSNLTGSFISRPEYKYTCAEVSFDLAWNADVSKTDSIMKEIRLYRETYQVWRPSATDTLAAVNVIQRRVVNYVVDSEFKKREIEIAREISVESDSVRVDFYDNGEVDGDSISVFFNNTLLAFNRILSARPVHFVLGLDDSREVNEISMFADNLGSIPPNTALMVVIDGNKRHEVRMTSNLEKNATVRIRRNKAKK